LIKLGKEPYSLSKKVKASVKKAVKFISDFETTATDLAIDNRYDFVICGHIHEPKIEERNNKKGTTTYLNSGDWIENLTALEYHKKKWKLYKHQRNAFNNEEEEYFEFEEKLCEQLIISNILTKK
jgi:UDP-2,3-diacylglucosamine pyrophosphatase LpxH